MEVDHGGDPRRRLSHPAALLPAEGGGARAALDASTSRSTSSGGRTRVGIGATPRGSTARTGTGARSRSGLPHALGEAGLASSGRRPRRPVKFRLTRALFPCPPDHAILCSSRKSPTGRGYPCLIRPQRDPIPVSKPVPTRPRVSLVGTESMDNPCRQVVRGARGGRRGASR